MNAQKLPGGLTYVIILNWITIATLIVAGFGVLLSITIPFIVGSGDAQSETQSMGLILIFAGVMGLVLWGLAFLYFLLNKGLKALRPGARAVQIVISILSLLSFPIGTALSGVALYFLLGDEKVKSAFGVVPPAGNPGG